ncbi:MAG: hypothetical protein H6637_03980, partial [Ardenticatenales bacterium]|nr:hypothetical protein [Ardenticatenales bacterium]
STLNNIYVVNLSTLLVDAILDVQSTQWAMDFRATAQTVELLVPLFDSQQIAVIDTQTERIIRMLNSSGNPSAVAYDQ